MNMNKIYKFNFLVFVIFLFNFNLYSQDDDLISNQQVEDKQLEDKQKLTVDQNDNKKQKLVDKQKNNDKQILEANKDEDTKEQKSKKPIIPEYENYIDSSNSLHLFLYKDENTEYTLINQKNIQNGKTLTLYSNDKLSRIFYDDTFFISYIEKWNIQKNVKDSKLEKISFYKKADDSENTCANSKQKFDVKILEYDLVKKNRIDFFYDERNQLLEKNIFKFIDDKQENISLAQLKEKKSRQEKSTVLKYDSFGRVTLEEEILYTYKYDNSLKYRQKNSRKNVYLYNNSTQDNKNPSVVNFYENDILRIKTVYRSENDYVQNIYFDDDMIVKLQYVDGKKVSEVFSIAGVEVIQK